MGLLRASAPTNPWSQRNKKTTGKFQQLGFNLEKLMRVYIRLSHCGLSIIKIAKLQILLVHAAY